MATWQSNRRKKRQAIAQPGPDALRAKGARADAARMAEPAPAYPPLHPESWRGYVLWCIDGVVTRVDLYRPPAKRNRPRCDRYEARVGDRLLTTGGLHAISRQAIADEIPRSMSLQALASIAG